MTDQEKIKALAELDGNPVPDGKCLCQRCSLKNDWHYLTSYDAIVPLVRKLDPNLRNDFIAILWKICGNEPSVNFWTEYNFRGLFSLLVATPTQLCEALLIATGKMKGQP